MASEWPQTAVDDLREDFEDTTENETIAADWQNLVSQAVKRVQSILGVGAENPKGVWDTVGERLAVYDLQRGVNGKGVVIHGSNASMARPTSGFKSYEWQGTVAPNNAIDGDTWLETG